VDDFGQVGGAAGGRTSDQCGLLAYRAPGFRARWGRDVGQGRGDRHTDTYSIPYADVYTYTQPYAHIDANGHIHLNGHRHSDLDLYAYANRHQHQHADSDPHCDANPSLAHTGRRLTPGTRTYFDVPPH
jgi:hypothetical protein